MRREVKSLRIGVHHADAVVWGPVYRTHLADHRGGVEVADGAGGGETAGVDAHRALFLAAETRHLAAVARAAQPPCMCMSLLLCVLLIHKCMCYDPGAHRACEVHGSTQELTE